MARMTNTGMTVGDFDDVIAARSEPSVIFGVLSTRGGLGLPIMTTEQRKAMTNPRKGILVFDETKDEIYFTGKNGRWKRIISETEEN